MKVEGRVFGSVTWREVDHIILVLSTISTIFIYFTMSDDSFNLNQTLVTLLSSIEPL